MTFVFWLGPIALLSLLPSTAIGLALHTRLLRHLRREHPREWERLGKPRLFRSNSVRNNLSVQRFLRRREYRLLGDPVLAGQVAVLRWLGRAYRLLFGVGTTWPVVIKS